MIRIASGARNKGRSTAAGRKLLFFLFGFQATKGRGSDIMHVINKSKRQEASLRLVACLLVRRRRTASVDLWAKPLLWSQPRPSQCVHERLRDSRFPKHPPDIRQHCKGFAPQMPRPCRHCGHCTQQQGSREGKQAPPLRVALKTQEPVLRSYACVRMLPGTI